MAYLYLDKRKRPAIWRFQYTDATGARRTGTGTTSRAETAELAREAEAGERAIAKGWRERPAGPTPGQLAADRDFETVKADYLRWGRTCGKKGPWRESHLQERTYILDWWQKTLGLRTLKDLRDIRQQVEKAVGDMTTADLAGKTVKNRLETLSAFCHWLQKRNLLDENPLKGLDTVDGTPRKTRRALTVPEIRALLDACEPERRLCYATAICTGLRRGELSALQVKHLDVDRCGLHLDATFTKNRRGGFQPLPRALADELAQRADGRGADEPLLPWVPKLTHGARQLEDDLTRAGLTKTGPGGVCDFHALRTTFATLCFDLGANPQEGQELVRHLTPGLTLQLYAKARGGRLAQLAESVGQAALPEPNAAAWKEGTNDAPLLDAESIPAADGAKAVRTATATSQTRDKSYEGLRVVEATGVEPDSVIPKVPTKVGPQAAQVGQQIPSTPGHCRNEGNAESGTTGQAAHEGPDAARTGGKHTSSRQASADELDALAMFAAMLLQLTARARRG